MMKKLIIFLVRRRLGLKLYQGFRFSNQRNPRDFYWFRKESLVKHDSITGETRLSNVSLNWLLSGECQNMIVIGG